MESFQYLVEIWGTFVPVRYSGSGIRDSINVFGIRSISRFKRFPGYVKAKKTPKRIWKGDFYSNQSYLAQIKT